MDGWNGYYFYRYFYYIIIFNIHFVFHIIVYAKICFMLITVQTLIAGHNKSYAAGMKRLCMLLTFRTIIADEKIYAR